MFDKFKKHMIIEYYKSLLPTSDKPYAASTNSVLSPMVKMQAIDFSVHTQRRAASLISISTLSVRKKHRGASNFFLLYCFFLPTHLWLGSTMGRATSLELNGPIFPAYYNITKHHWDGR